jgi:hypothetical protein
MPADSAGRGLGSPTSAFLTDILGSALAIDRAMQRQSDPAQRDTPDPVTPDTQEPEPSAGKVIPLTPRRQRVPAKPPCPPSPDNDDPGPSAA